MVVITNNNTENEKDPLEIMKSSSINETEFKSPKSSNTRELIRKARETADKKFAQTINKTIVETPTKNKIVLKAEESAAWHGNLTKIKLTRPKPTIIKPKTNVTSPTVQNITGPRGSKCLFEFYKEIRREYEDFKEIEASRLKRRLEKLSDFPLESETTNFEEFEKKIIPWQSDSSTISCYLCTEEFSLLNRRHHCRLCGRIICSSCSQQNIPIKLLSGEGKELKSCEKCFGTLFRKKIEGNLLNNNEKRMQTIYKQIKSLREQLLETIPKFNQYLLEESVTVARPLKQWHQDAWALRDTLILYSVHFRSLMQELAEICDVEGLERSVFRVMAGNLRRAANEFIQKHMFTLQIINFEPINSGANSNNDDNIHVQKQFTNTQTSTQQKSTDWKNLVPTVINELFSSSLKAGLFEFYTSEGDLISLDDPKVLKDTLRNQESILKEQLDQLNLEMARKRASGEETTSIETAVEDIKRELDRLKRLK